MGINFEIKEKKTITIPIDNQVESYLTGNMITIKDSKSLVIFAHGSGSGIEPKESICIRDTKQ